MTLNDLSHVDELARFFDTAVKKILDKHAPQKTSIRTLRPHQPWYNDTIHTARRLRRKYERRWKKSKLEVDRQFYVYLYIFGFGLVLNGNPLKRISEVSYLGWVPTRWPIKNIKNTENQILLVLKHIYK